MVIPYIFMNPIGELRKEHIAIERELFELESIMEDELINYPNLVHTFRNLCEIWDPHEHEEEKIFAIMSREKVDVPVSVMTCEHKDISGHIGAFKNAINSGDDSAVRDSLKEDLRVIVNKIREHMLQEDEVLYSVALNFFTDEELAEMVDALDKKE